MIGAIQHFGQDAQRHLNRCDFFTLDAGDLLFLQARKILFRKCGIQNDISINVERGVKIGFERRKRNRGGIEIGTRAEIGAEIGKLLANLQSGAGFGALIQHVHGKSRGAGNCRLIRRITGIDQQIEIDHRNGRALRQNDFQTIREGGALQRRKFHFRRRPGNRQLRPINLRFRGFIIGERMHFENVNAVRQPLFGGVMEILCRGFTNAVQRGFVIIRGAAINLILRENVGFAAEAADALNAANEARFVLRFDALQFRRGRAFGEKLGQLFVNRLFDFCQIAAGLGRRVNVKLAGDFTRIQIGRDVGGNLLVVHETFIQARNFAQGQYIGGEIQIIVVGRAPLRDVPNFKEPGLRHPILHLLALRAAAFGNPHIVFRNRRTGGNIAEIFFHFRLGGGGIDIAGHDDHRVGRAIISFKPIFDIIERSGVEIFHRADDRPRIRMAGRPRTFDDQLLRHTVRFIFALAFFVLYDAALLIELGLINRAEQVAHAVGLHPQRNVHYRNRHILKIIGAIFIRRAVQIGRPELLHHFEIILIEIFAAIEHQMLEQMRKAAFAGFLILRTDVVPHIHRHDRRFVIFVHDERQPIGQHEFLVRNVDVAAVGSPCFCQHQRRSNQQQTERNRFDLLFHLSGLLHGFLG
ncbi:MAG: hypothetical protein ALAOOOJD_02834 [bacterium]|nr:hypothetical protein [bacterium]